MVVTPEELPPELLACVAHLLDAESLLSLGVASRGLHAAVDDPLLWRTRLRRQHSRILASLFDGSVPEPRSGLSWKQHFFDFSTSWKDRAMRQTPGRLLLVISSTEAAPRGSGLRRATARETYGVYDVSSYVDDHPGADVLLAEAAEERDASGLFGDAWHSDAARRKLLSLAVPGLEALSRDEALGSRCHRRHRSWWHQPWDARSFASGLTRLVLALAAAVLCAMPDVADALLGHMLDAPCLASALIGCAALQRWPWEVCAGATFAAVVLAVRCGAVLEMIEFGRAIYDSPALPGATAAVALFASHARDRSTAKSLVHRPM